MQSFAPKGVRACPARSRGGAAGWRRALTMWAFALTADICSPFDHVGVCARVWGCLGARVASWRQVLEAPLCAVLWAVLWADHTARLHLVCWRHGVRGSIWFTHGPPNQRHQCNTHTHAHTHTYTHSCTAGHNEPATVC